ncbi:MAG TPA: YeeE/YedE family protein [Geminicoccus sp.]|uniref:YeeE/YedE family protein n=1 Tax=Geminicoccus sp. TaxID=2024832 RepID=UPI002CD49C19|nr:YeeE/YedE family protein [Geminicoccus sp.]HWL72221.1 YeeE/YedE family protein [Geminicoccus sp.]
MASLAHAQPAPVAAGPAMRPLDRTVAILALLLLAAAALYAGNVVSLKNGALVLVGSLLGVALYHAAFGFTGGWRAFVTERRSASLRAQFLLLALATVLMVPVIAWGEVLGRPVNGFTTPIGIPLVAGAFLFGLGMQLGGGCGSGTLFTVGGGSARMLVTLLAFIAGSMLGVAHAPAWNSLPNLGSFSLWQQFGVLPTLVLSLAALGGLAYLAARAEQRRTGKLAPLGWSGGATPRLLTGPWPLLWGAVALALLSLLTLLVAGHPWGITGAFALWGAKGLAALGVDVAAWDSWSGAGARAQLEGSLFAHPISAMDIGLILGAMIAASLAGRFGPKVDLRLGSLAAAVLGGLLMGYGARMSSGCNIGALLGGIASGSLHGWIWFAMAFLGSLVGIRLRPLFRLNG